MLWVWPDPKIAAMTIIFDMPGIHMPSRMTEHSSCYENRSKYNRSSHTNEPGTLSCILIRRVWQVKHHNKANNSSFNGIKNNISTFLSMNLTSGQRRMAACPSCALPSAAQTVSPLAQMGTGSHPG